MRISTKLLLAALVPAVMALVSVVGVVRTYSQVVELQRRQSTVIELRTVLDQLNGFANTYLLRHDQQSRRQFLTANDRAAQLIAVASTGGDPRYGNALRTSADDLASAESLFLSIIQLNESSRSPAPVPETEPRLSARLFQRIADANTAAAGLVRLLSADIVLKEAQDSTLVALFTVLAAGVLTTGLLALRKGITESLHVLKKGTEAIGAGNLDYRIGLSRPDELSDLGRAFDQMSERLEGVTVSRDVLEEEIRERRRAEERAQRELERTKLLQDVTRTATSSLSLSEIGQRVLALTSVRLGLSSGSIWAVDRPSAELRTLAHTGQSEEARPPESLLIDEASAIGQLVLHGLPLVTQDRPPVSTALREREMQLETKRWVVMPIKGGDETLGVLGLVFEGRRPFDEDELSLYQSITELLGSAMENARKYETERDIATRLQEALLKLPDGIPGLSFAHAYRSATESAFVGGDFYDIFELNHHHVGITIGDIAGNGIDAAVLTSLVKNTIRAHAGEIGKTPAQVLTLANDVVFKATPPEAFATVFFALLDCRDGRLVYANAGHTTAAVVREDGTTAKLPVTGPLLGAFAEARFEQAEVRLDVGELLFLYTDGLTEARRDAEQFGEERVFALLSSTKDGAPDHVIGEVIEAVLSFTEHRLRDDLAMFAVKRLKHGAAVPAQQKLEL